MIHSTSWVPSTEVAFIAGLTDKEINRALDEDVLPDNLVRRSDGREFARFVSLLVKFYFETSRDLSKPLRLSVIETLNDRVLRRDDADSVLALHFALSAFDWKVPVSFGLIELSNMARFVLDRAAGVEKANRTIEVDPNVMGGLPVFMGTRVPIDTVTSSKAAGISDERLIASYPFLTPELIQDAEIYLQVHPRRGRPRKLGELNPGWTPQESKVVRRGQRE